MSSSLIGIDYAFEVFQFFPDLSRAWSRSLHCAFSCGFCPFSTQLKLSSTLYSRVVLRHYRRLRNRYSLSIFNFSSCFHLVSSVLLIKLELFNFYCTKFRSWLTFFSRLFFIQTFNHLLSRFYPFINQFFTEVCRIFLEYDVLGIISLADSTYGILSRIICFIKIKNMKYFALQCFIFTLVLGPG